MSLATCATCRHYRPQRTEDGPDQGTCRATSPTFISQGGRAVWPIVMAHEDCGDHATVPRGSDGRPLVAVAREPEPAAPKAETPKAEQPAAKPTPAPPKKP